MVIEDNGQVVGAIYGEKVKGDGLILWLFAVDASYRNKGMGDKLLNKFEANARKNNIKWIILYAPKLNESTQKFYKNRGYSMGTTNVECLKRL